MYPESAEPRCIFFCAGITDGPSLQSSQHGILCEACCIAARMHGRCSLRRELRGAMFCSCGTVLGVARPRRERCADAQELFLQRCFYTAGPYDTPTGYKELNTRMNEQERATGKVRGHANTVTMQCSLLTQLWPRFVADMRRVQATVNSLCTSLTCNI